MSNICKYYYKKKLTDKQRQNKKDLALKRLIKKINVDKLDKKAIKNTFEILDEIYFDNQISERINDINAKMSFDVSNRLSCTAGYCEYSWKTDYYGNKKWKFKLIISNKIINNLFSNKESALKINGLKCRNKLECYLNLYQHELIHLLLFVFCLDKGKDYGGHTDTFIKIANNLFGHTEYKHNLLCGDADKNEIDDAKFRKEVQLGDEIKSKKIKDKIYQGPVFRLTSKYAYILLPKNRKIGIPYYLIEKIVKKNNKKTDFKIKEGMKVKFILKGKEVSGKVVKVNKTRIRVDVEGKLWNVPLELIYN